MFGNSFLRHEALEATLPVPPISLLHLIAIQAPQDVSDLSASDLSVAMVSSFSLLFLFNMFVHSHCVPDD